MSLIHNTKFDENYNLIEYLEKDTQGNILAHEKYDEFGNIIYKLKGYGAWDKNSYVRFTNLESKEVITKVSYTLNSMGLWTKYEYHDHENGMIGVRLEHSSGTKSEYCIMNDGNMSLTGSMTYITSMMSDIHWTVYDTDIELDDEVIDNIEFTADITEEDGHSNREMLLCVATDSSPPTLTLKII